MAAGRQHGSSVPCRADGILWPADGRLCLGSRAVSRLPMHAYIPAGMCLTQAVLRHEFDLKMWTRLLLTVLSQPEKGTVLSILYVFKPCSCLQTVITVF